METRTDAAMRKVQRAVKRDLEDARELFEEGAAILRRTTTLAGVGSGILQNANAVISSVDEEIKKREEEAS